VLLSVGIGMTVVLPETAAIGERRDSVARVVRVRATPLFRPFGSSPNESSALPR